MRIDGAGRGYSLTGNQTEAYTPHKNNVFSYLEYTGAVLDKM